MKLFLNYVWYVAKLALILIVGCGASWAALVLLGRAQAEPAVASLTIMSPIVWGRLDTAVKMIGGFFILLWGGFFLNEIFFGKRWQSEYGLISRRSLSPSRLVVSPFVHRDEKHLRSNSKLLLLCVGVTAFIVSNAQIFFLATIIIFLCDGLGTWVFGSSDKPQIGASGLALGYYSFNLGYSWITWNVWWLLISVVLLFFFGKIVWQNITKKQENVSLISHVSGFAGGLLAAGLVTQLV